MSAWVHAFRRPPYVTSVSDTRCHAFPARQPLISTHFSVANKPKMLCRHALAQRIAVSRSLSTQSPPSSHDILNLAFNAVTQGANPLIDRPAVEDLDLPPRAGPDGYTSTRPNPMSKKYTDLYAFDTNTKYFRFDCHSTRNNTITTLSSIDRPEAPFKPPKSKVVAWFSGGSVGFKKGQRAGYEAGYQCAVRVFKLLEELKRDHGDRTSVHLYLKGFGQGREALKTALMSSEGDKIRAMITTVTDRTALKIGGTRSKKTRRL